MCYKHKVIVPITYIYEIPFIFRFELGSFPIRMIISGTTSHFSSKDELQEVCDSLLPTI